VHVGKARFSGIEEAAWKAALGDDSLDHDDPNAVTEYLGSYVADNMGLTSDDRARGGESMMADVSQPPSLC
jgi:hypothetical protein